MITLFDFFLISVGASFARPFFYAFFCAILSCLFAEWSGLAYDRSFLCLFYLLPIAQKKAYRIAWFCALLILSCYCKIIVGYGIALMHKCDVRIGLLDCAKDTICGEKSAKLRHLQIIVWRYKIRIEIKLE